MSPRCKLVLLILATAAPVGCIQTSSERNPFLTLAEQLGVTESNGNGNTGTGGSGATATADFRRTMTLTFSNGHTDAEANTKWVAWVGVSSIRNADQQDALLRAGYVQLTRQTDLGSAFSLPPGTFVYNGPGIAGATTVAVPAAGTGAPKDVTFSLITPDAIVAFVQPPVSCDSPAFYYTRNGDIINDTGVNSGVGFDAVGVKTLAQVDVYQCEPLKPGVFLKLGGGARKPDEFVEGENVTFAFSRLPDANGFFANVIIGN